MTQEELIARDPVRGARHTLVLGDIVSLALVSLAIAAFSGDVAHTAVKAVAGTLGLLLACCSMGIYGRTYANVPLDEIYPVIAAGALALLSCAIVTIAVWPHHDGLAACKAIALGSVSCSIVHVLFHVPDDGLSAPLSATSRLPVNAPFGRAAKRCFDLALTILISVPVACACVVIAGIVYLDDGAPVFFFQERVGRDKKVFRIIKFRTMRTDADRTWAVRGDCRLTRSGRLLRRWSLDELPQLFNVIRGEMSLVGPRPEMVAYAAAFERTLPGYAQRSCVKPGITGWAQVTQPRDLNVDDIPAVLAADLFYIRRWSIAFDIVIVVKTAAEVFFHRAV